MFKPIKKHFRRFWLGSGGERVAAWQGVELARSENTLRLEGNDYFPMQSLQQQYFEASDFRSHCAWKGEAFYFHVRVNGKVNENAAWYYPEPKPAAANIKNRVAFWNGIKVALAAPL